MADGYSDLPLFQSREAALSALEIAREGYIAVARRTADRIIAEKGSCTIDDVRRELPPPDTVDPRVMGAVFNSKRYRKVGYTQSQACGREAHHTRPIAVFARGAAQ